MGVLTLGWDTPLGQGGSGGWDWWALLGSVSLFLLILGGRRRPPVGLAVALAALGGLVLADLTDAWGVVPVWGSLMVVALARNLRRGIRRRQV